MLPSDFHSKQSRPYLPRGGGYTGQSASHWSQSQAQYHYNDHGQTTRNPHFHPHSQHGYHHSSGEHDRGGYFVARGQGRGGSRGRPFNRGRGRGGNGSNRNHNHFQRQKAKEENDFRRESFYCCACERGFKTQEMYDEHNKEHIVCGLDGCQFEAHSLVVTKHIRMQHEGNLFERMKNLNTPEDIKRWREERKKNFPTSQKVQEKEDETKEKTERREFFNVRESNKPFDPNVFCYRIRKNDPRNFAYAAAHRRLFKAERNQGDGWMKRSFAPDMKLRHIRVPFFSMNKSSVVTLENFYMSVKQGKDGKLKKEKKVKWKGFFAKTLERLPDSDSEEDAMPISDEEDYFADPKSIEDDVQKSENRTMENSACDISVVAQKPCLGLSLVNYSSASESEEDNDNDEGVKEETISSDTQLEKDDTLQSSTIDSSETSQTHSGVQSIFDSIPSESIKQEETDSDSDSEAGDSFTIQQFDTDTTFKDKLILSTLPGRRFVKRRRPRLIETLLKDEIRKERNALLQVCRFVTENNFFKPK